MNYFKEDNVKTFEVQFDRIADVKNFVEMANGCKGSVTITSRENYVCDSKRIFNYICDGKSIMNMFGMDLSNPVEVACDEIDFNTVFDFCDSAHILVG